MRINRRVIHIAKHWSLPLRQAYERWQRELDGVAKDTPQRVKCAFRAPLCDTRHEKKRCGK